MRAFELEASFSQHFNFSLHYSSFSVCHGLSYPCFIPLKNRTTFISHLYQHTKAQTDWESSTQQNEWGDVICDGIKLARTGNKGSFSMGLISREPALQSHCTLPWALGYAVTFSLLSLRQLSSRRTAVVMTLPYDCVGHSTFKIC